MSMIRRGMVSRGIVGRGIVKRGIVRRGNILNRVPFIEDAIWYGRGGVADGTETDVVDRIGTLDAAKYVGNSCITFSGGQIVQTGIDVPYLTAFEFGMWFKLGSPNANQYLVFQGKDNIDYSFRVFFLFGTLTVCVGRNVTLDVGTVNQFTDGEWYFVKVISNGTTYTTTVYNDELVQQATASRAVGGTFTSGNFPFIVGARYGGTIDTFTFYANNCSVCGIYHTTGDLNFSCTDGYGSVLYNRAGSSHGNITFVTGGSLDVIWGQTQDVLASNAKEGFSLYEHYSTDPEIRVPYSSAGEPLVITPPTGYSLVRHYPPGTYLPPIEGGIEQQDAVFYDGETSNAWTSDGTTKTALTWAEHREWRNGSNNLWIKWNTEKDQVDYALQWPFDKEWTVNEIFLLQNHFGETPDGGMIELLTMNGNYILNNGYVVYT